MDGVLQHYRTQWQSTSDTPGFMESSNSGWHIIGRLTEGYQWVVQVKARTSRSGSEGIISLLALQSSKTKGLQQVNFIPVPRGASLVSTTHSEAPSLARTQTMVFSGRPARVADNYKRHALEHGWELQDEFTHKRAVTLRFERAGRQLDVALANAQYGENGYFYQRGHPWVSLTPSITNDVERQAYPNDNEVRYSLNIQSLQELSL